MRILHVITMLDVGGAERLLVDLLPLLRDKGGHQVDLLVFNGVDTILKENIKQKGITVLNSAMVRMSRIIIRKYMIRPILKG